MSRVYLLSTISAGQDQEQVNVILRHLASRGNNVTLYGKRIMFIFYHSSKVLIKLVILLGIWIKVLSKYCMLNFSFFFRHVGICH